MRRLLRPHSDFSASSIIAALLVLALIAGPPAAIGEERFPNVSAPAANAPQPGYQPRGPRPSVLLDRADELATLHAIDTALSEVGDGATYVWQRGHGLLNGLIRPTTSFKSAQGQVCRHVIIMLTSNRYTRQLEGIACRDADGAWTLSG